MSAQRCALAAKAYRKHPTSTDSFVEELVVRRELADNFCFYNPHYDSLEGCYAWAKDSLQLHSADPRPHLYSLEQLEAAQTRDDLWNAAQLQVRIPCTVLSYLVLTSLVNSYYDPLSVCLFACLFAACLFFLAGGIDGQDARLPAHVLGQEDPRVESEPR